MSLKCEKVCFEPLVDKYCCYSPVIKDPSTTVPNIFLQAFKAQLVESVLHIVQLSGKALSFLFHTLYNLTRRFVQSYQEVVVALAISDHSMQVDDQTCVEKFKMYSNSLGKANIILVLNKSNLVLIRSPLFPMS